jgi:hypothetical protein
VVVFASCISLGAFGIHFLYTLGFFDERGSLLPAANNWKLCWVSFILASYWHVFLCRRKSPQNQKIHTKVVKRGAFSSLTSFGSSTGGKQQETQRLSTATSNSVVKFGKTPSWKWVYFTYSVASAFAASWTATEAVSTFQEGDRWIFCMLFLDWFDALHMKLNFLEFCFLFNFIVILLYNRLPGNNSDLMSSKVKYRLQLPRYIWPSYHILSSRSCYLTSYCFVVHRTIWLAVSVHFKIVFHWRLGDAGGKLREHSKLRTKSKVIEAFRR